MDANRRAYVAIARSLIDDLRYRRPAGRPLTHLEALLWLISHAAWRPRGQPNRFGAIHNERAQVSVTYRGLAKEWAWSRGKVGYFLAELAREETVALALVRCGERLDKTLDNVPAKVGYRRTLITLVNYDKFNAVLRTVGRKVGQSIGQGQGQLPGLLCEIATKPNLNKESEFKKRKRQPSRGGGVVANTAPRHGQKWNSRVFLRFPTAEWEAHAADFEAAHGFRPAPTRYLDGVAGTWFSAAGEAAVMQRSHKLP